MPNNTKKTKYAKQLKREGKRQTWLCLEPATLQELDERQAAHPIFKSQSRSAFLRYIVQSWLADWQSMPIMATK